MVKNQNGIIELIIVGVVALLGIGGGAAVVASRSAAPGDMLFPLKTQIEDLRLNTAGSGKGKASVNLDISKSDLKEIEKLQRQNKSDRLQDSIDSLLEHEQEAEDDLASAKSKGDDVTELENELKDHKAHTEAVLAAILAKAPEAAHKGLERAIEAVKKSEVKKENKEKKNQGAAKPESSSKNESSGTEENHSNSSGSNPTSGSRSGSPDDSSSPSASSGSDSGGTSGSDDGGNSGKH